MLTYYVVMLMQNKNKNNSTLTAHIYANGKYIWNLEVWSNQDCPKMAYSAKVRQVEKWSRIHIWDWIITKSWEILPTGRPNHNIKFQWNRWLLITYDVILLTPKSDQLHILLQESLRRQKWKCKSKDISKDKEICKRPTHYHHNTVIFL